MKQLAPYLFFKGHADEALAFYAAAGLGHVKESSRYADAPGGQGMPGGEPHWLMHASFEGEGVSFMASDAPRAEPMKGVAMSIGLDDLPEAERLFAALSAGGQVTMPMEKTFWGAHFGQFTDKFGVQWMVNCEA